MIYFEEQPETALVGELLDFKISTEDLQLTSGFTEQNSFFENESGEQLRATVVTILTATNTLLVFVPDATPQGTYNFKVTLFNTITSEQFNLSTSTPFNIWQKEDPEKYEKPSITSARFAINGYEINRSDLTMDVFVITGRNLQSVDSCLFNNPQIQFNVLGHEESMIRLQAMFAPDFQGLKMSAPMIHFCLIDKDGYVTQEGYVEGLQMVRFHGE